jgi:hypothetical protein
MARTTLSKTLPMQMLHRLQLRLPQLLAPARVTHGLSS